MVVVGGESNSSDLGDLWVLDLESKCWKQPEIDGKNTFSAKRFHTASTIQKTKVVTFGGCHSEYVHLNDLNIFDLKQFLEDPVRGTIVCTKVEVTSNSPTSRWGHSATVLNEKSLFILGGRNENDISDVHVFDADSESWSPLQIDQSAPKPRRRHSCILVSGCVVMFGGFDGEFYNDLHLLDVLPTQKDVNVTPSTKAQDYLGMVNSQADSDITLKIGSECLHLHKALLLFKAVPYETAGGKISAASSSISELVQSHECPEFMKLVYRMEKGEEFDLGPQFLARFEMQARRAKAAMSNLCELLYSGRTSTQLTLSSCQDLLNAAQFLNLKNYSYLISTKVCHLRQKLNCRISRDFQLAKCRTLAPGAAGHVELCSALEETQRTEAAKTLKHLENCLVHDFALDAPSTSLCASKIQSPEEERDKLHSYALQEMKATSAIDEFADIVFKVENSYIKGYSPLLKARSPYFRAMLSRTGPQHFQESEAPCLPQGSSAYRVIRVEGVPKVLVQCLLQYLYSDHFYIAQQSIDFFLRLLIAADYFMVDRLRELCSKYAKEYISVTNVLPVLLIAYSHNAIELENFCLKFISLNEAEILGSSEWQTFKKHTQPRLFKTLVMRLLNKKEDTFVQTSVECFIKENSSQVQERIVPPQSGEAQPPRYSRVGRRQPLRSLQAGNGPNEGSESSSSSPSSH